MKWNSIKSYLKYAGNSKLGCGWYCALVKYDIRTQVIKFLGILGFAIFWIKSPLFLCSSSRKVKKVVRIRSFKQ